MTQEHRYSLTRVCLRRGELTLPRGLSGRFPSGTTVEAVDSQTGNVIPLTAEGERLLRGLGGFFEEHELSPNDVLRIKLAENGQVKITPQRRERRQQSGTVPAAAEIIRVLRDAAPVTEAEARTLVPGMPAGFDLKGFLERTGEFVFRAGRWQVAAAYSEAADRAGAEGEAEAAPEAAAPAPAPGSETGEPPSGQSFQQEVFRTLGFEVDNVGAGTWLLECPTYRVIVQEAAPGRRLDWGALLEERRRHQAGWLAVTGEHADLLALVAPAELAQATLWPEHALDRLLQLSRSLPLGPADLEQHFRQHGLWDAGLQKFERTVQKRIAERGAFSQVLSNLAELDAPGAFTLEEAGRGLGTEAARLVLLQLSRSPFQLVLQQADGSWYLRDSVHTALGQLAEYATSLLAHLPPARPRVRSSSRTAGARERELQRG